MSHNHTGKSLMLVTALALATFLMGAGYAPATSATSSAMAAHARLRHAPRGLAHMMFDTSTHMLHAMFLMQGLAPARTGIPSQHMVMIHAGDCTDPGMTVADLGMIAADAQGDVDMMVTDDHLNSQIQIQDGMSLVVHNGNSLTSTLSTYMIACGAIQLTSTGTMHMAQVKFGPTVDPSQNANGSAHLKVTSDKTLQVTIAAHNLEPDSMHMAHIHSGSCAAQGGVVYDLGMLQADDNGDIDVTHTFPNVMSIPITGWYVNIHLTTNLATSEGFDPILCGDVKLG